MQCESFPPLYRVDAKVLILGTMPSVASLGAHQYYAHPRNAFWPIQNVLWGRKCTDYHERTQMMLDNGIALWDTVCQCQREGSLDAAMQSIVPNDIAGLARELPQLWHVFLNGKTAYQLYRKSFPDLKIPSTVLPSTSPAYTLPFEQKLEAWRVVAQVVHSST